MLFRSGDKIVSQENKIVAQKNTIVSQGDKIVSRKNRYVASQDNKQSPTRRTLLDLHFGVLCLPKNFSASPEGLNHIKLVVVHRQRSDRVCNC